MLGIYNVIHALDMCHSQTKNSSNANGENCVDANLMTADTVS